ncbi:MAG: hypothetical protein GXO25_05930 [Euryarchaeota archaeon]|nr:hypothetical protein [Euryarchaeota archaeon]
MIDMCRLDNEEIKEKIENLFSTPGTFQDLPPYIVAAWTRPEGGNSGMVVNTFHLGDLARLLVLLNRTDIEMILYEFDPVDYVFNKEFTRMVNPVEVLV